MGYIRWTLNLDSPRFLSKAAKVAYCQIDADRSPGSRSDQKVAEVSEKAEGTKMAFLRLAGTNERINRENLERY